MAKNLPIKIFYKRENDELFTEAGGNNEKPKWTLSNQALSKKAHHFVSRFSEVGAKLERKLSYGYLVPSVIKVKVREDIKAKTYRDTISKLFSTKKRPNIIGMAGEAELLVKIDGLEDLNEIIGKFSSPEFNDVGISALEDAELFSPVKQIDPASDRRIKVKLFNYDDYELNRVLLNEFENLCGNNSIKCTRVEYSKDLHIYGIERASLDALDQLEEFDGIFSITEVPEIDITLDSVNTDIDDFPIKEPEPGREYPVIGILDNGVADNDHLSPWLTDSKYCPFSDSDVNREHGTFVSGLIVYGDELEGRQLTGTSGCKIFDATVFPTGYWDEIELVREIRNAISENPDVKIWNLSLGTKNESDIDSFSDFGKALDELQEEYGILIVKSTGNCYGFVNGDKKSRIAKSADSVRSLVIGSIAHKKNITDQAEIDSPSPFTRIGPGPANIVKPELVHYGGNAGVLNGRIVPNGVHSISLTGNKISNIGTSFSTPRVAALAAEVDFAMADPFNPLLIKALLIHSARYPTDLGMAMDERIKQVGYGLPSSLDDIIFNDENEITLILQDRIEKGKFINVMDFPFPESLIDNGYFYGEITVTLVTDPILASDQGSEYCQSNVDVYFGSYDQKFDRDTAKKTIKNPIGLEGTSNVLRDALYSKTAVKDRNNKFNTERVLINYHKKYQPVKKWVINLAEMTDGNRERHLKAPKRWFLKLRALFRQHTELRAQLSGRELSVDFALIITIKDPQKRGTLYNQVSQLLDQFNFLHNNIKITDTIKVRMGG